MFCIKKVKVYNHVYNHGFRPYTKNFSITSFFFKVEIMISDIIEGCDDYLREYMHLKHVKNST